MKDGFIWVAAPRHEERHRDDADGNAARLAQGFRPPGDVILAVVSDEEPAAIPERANLVENHASQFDGVRYAIGEFGGFTFHIGNRVFYPIMVAEKQGCWMKATLRGPRGNG